ncbi:MAG: radical SAM family heme chaperone HemW [Vicingus serpentipes]|nr:radical SAM family heme chaperone HemW [Vicingus serpentipes]
MAGLYIHIPFCKQKCSYCDFHFSTSLKYKTDLIQALLKEIEIKQDQIKEPIQTIYFGGGTPSILHQKELSSIVERIYTNYKVAEVVEFTLECNPDDIDSQKLKELKSIGVNRLSMGVQSFFDDDLQFFNRAHNANEAERSILKSQDEGFENITIDLIYGTPLLTDKKWKQNLEKIRDLNVSHLSAYTLTVEPKTALHHQVKTGQITPLSDEKVVRQLEMLIEQTKKYGLTQYEVSNFGKEGFYSLHNSNYWKGVEYLGFGPSAHSYIGEKRYWNISNNAKYIDAINANTNYFEEEVIDEKTAYNEYVLTRLRTIWGVDLTHLKTNFREEVNTHFEKEAAAYLKSAHLLQEKEVITLTHKGLFIADKITSDLFFV